MKYIFVKLYNKNKVINLNIFRNITLLLVFVFGMMSFDVSAQKEVSGVVVDENGQSLVGAAIIVQKERRGTITDVNGGFKISVKKGDILVFSYLGYRNYNLRIDKFKKDLRIVLKPDTKFIDDVVVVGYGSMKRSDLTGAVSSVNSQQIKGYKTSSVLEALGGQVAGVQITQQDGTPGAGFDIKIRGVGTVTGDASPLYIVDGFEVDDIGYLSPNDIKDIQILKDASSSAIYGARAANGVVSVTTKSGEVGKPVISYSGSGSYREISNTLDMLSPYEFVKLQMEINPDRFEHTYYRSGSDDDGVPYKYQSLEDYKGVKGINWQDETFRPTWSQDHNVSISGGNKKSKYFFSFSDYSENGIFKNSGFNKTTAKMKISQSLTKKINLQTSIYYSKSVRDGAGTSSGSGRFNALAQVLSARPTGGLKVSDYDLLNKAIDPLELELSESLAQVNPILQAESVFKKRAVEAWSANLALSVNIVKGLKFKATGTYQPRYYRNDLFYHDGSKEAYRNGKKPYGETYMGKSTRWTQNNVFTWNKKINKHSMNVMLGEELSVSTSEGLTGQAKDFPFDNLGNDNLGIGPTPSKVTTSYYEKRLLSFFTRVNYNYRNKYLFTGTLRADGSTVFSDSNKWGIFPSFSLAWRVNNEEFMKNINFISNLKFRLGWGTVGNDRISNFLSLDLYYPSKLGLGTKMFTVLSPKQLRNKNLKWEGSSTFNIGVDVGLLKNRINFNAEYFIKNTKDLLLAQSLAYVTGFASQYQNIGKIQNKGFELSLNTVNIRSGKFMWKTTINFSTITNELKALQKGLSEMYAYSRFNSEFTGYDYIAKVGSPLGLIYGYEFDGVYQDSDFDVTPGGKRVLSQGVTNNIHYGKVHPGVIKYKDQNGDNLITPEDRTVIGNTLPDWYGGITNNISYNGFDFSMLWQFNYGNDVYNATRLYMTQSHRERRNLMAEVSDRWQPNNASNLVPSAKGYIRNELNSRFVEDGSFLRLKNITLGYSLPKEFLQRYYIDKLRFYVSAQNLLCLTKYSGYDPEVSMRKNNPMTPGLDWGAYPRSKVFVFGVELKF